MNKEGYIQITREYLKDMDSKGLFRESDVGYNLAGVVWYRRKEVKTRYSCELPILVYLGVGNGWGFVDISGKDVEPTFKAKDPKACITKVLKAKREVFYTPEK